MKKGYKKRIDRIFKGVMITKIKLVLKRGRLFYMRETGVSLRNQISLKKRGCLFCPEVIRVGCLSKGLTFP